MVKRVNIKICFLAICMSVFLGACNLNESTTNEETSKGITENTLKENTPKENKISESIKWINGTHAVLIKVNRGDLNLFGGMAHNSLNKQIVLNSLDDSWGIKSKIELDDMISELTVGLHNPRFLDELEEYGISDMNRSEFEEALEGVDDREDIIFFRNMFDAYETYSDKAIFGWDLSRAAQLCSYGYIVDFYTYDEAANKAIDIGIQIQKTFDSWNDFYASYLYGYEYWSEDDVDDKNSGYNQRVKILEELKKDGNSPLNLDWNFDLKNN